MAYSQKYIKVTFGGTLAGGQDIWSAGFHIADTNSADTVNAWNNLNGVTSQSITALIATFLTSPEALIPRGVTAEWVKYALIAEDGKYVEAPIENILADMNGGVNSQYVPQVAVVCTLVSEKYRDPGKYNRFYLPTVVPTGTDGYRLTTSNQNALATKVAGLIFSINEITMALSPGLEVRVVTQKEVQSYLPVVSTRVGRIYDTQRRRRNKLPEEYVTKPIAA